MKVFVGDQVFDSNKIPIVVWLGEASKKCLRDIKPDQQYYIAWPEEQTHTKKQLLKRAKSWPKT